MCVRERRPLPKVIENAPRLQLGLEFYYRAFFELTNSRNIGFSVGAIPWHVIRMYCNENKLTSEQTERMHFFISRMDFTYLDFLGKKK